MLSHDLTFGCPRDRSRAHVLWDECSIRGTNVPVHGTGTPIPSWFCNADDLLRGAHELRCVRGQEAGRASDGRIGGMGRNGPFSLSCPSCPGGSESDAEADPELTR